MPQALKRSGPLVERPDPLGIGAIKHLAAFAANVNQADVAQDAQVL